MRLIGGRGGVLAALVLGLAACGARPKPALEGEDTAGADLQSGLPSVQLYAVLTADPAAMQAPEDVPEMWRAVEGAGPRYGPVRQLVRWVPGDYRLELALDFADLPHPAVPRKRFEALARGLPAPAQARVASAKLAVFFRSDGPSLPGGDHVRLAGLAALQAADRFEGVVFDLIARKAWTPEAWRAELARPRLEPEAHRSLVERPDGEGHLWLATRGEAKFGRPDLQLRRVPLARRDEARAALAAALSRAAGRVLSPAGQLDLPAGPVGLGPCEAPPRFFDAACVQLNLP